jgi:hypothetical protein
MLGVSDSPPPYSCPSLSSFQIAVSTVRYLVELRGWNGIALSAVHARDAKIYIDDPGPWILGLATEARYSVRPAPEVCVIDLYVALCTDSFVLTSLLPCIGTSIT